MNTEYKFVTATVTTGFNPTSTDMLETAFAEDAQLVGMRIEKLAGDFDEFLFSMQSLSDSQGAVYSKIYPFELRDTVKMENGVLIRDVEFAKSLNIQRGYKLKLLGENFLNATGSPQFKDTLYYI